MTLPSNTKEGIENSGNAGSTDLENLHDAEGQGLNNSENNESGEDQSGNESEESATAAPEPNIIFVGEGEPVTKINNGMETIKLPAVAVQADEETVPPQKEGEVETKKFVGKPFYHKQAGAIIQLFPGEYKRFVKKGE